MFSFPLCQFLWILIAIDSFVPFTDRAIPDASGTFYVLATRIRDNGGPYYNSAEGPISFMIFQKGELNDPVAKKVTDYKFTPLGYLSINVELVSPKTGDKMLFAGRIDYSPLYIEIVPDSHKVILVDRWINNKVLLANGQVAITIADYQKKSISKFTLRHIYCEKDMKMLGELYDLSSILFWCYSFFVIDGEIIILPRVLSKRNFNNPVAYGLCGENLFRYSASQLVRKIYKNPYLCIHVYIYTMYYYLSVCCK